MATLKDYIISRTIVLKQLKIYKYCTEEEKTRLKQAQSEIQVDNLCHAYRNKYFNIMLADYEKAHPSPTKQNDVSILLPADKSVLKCGLSRKTENALLRNHLTTTKQFIDFVTQHGWSSLRTFGEGGATEVFSKIYDTLSEQEIKQLVWQTKNQKLN